LPIFFPGISLRSPRSLREKILVNHTPDMRKGLMFAWLAAAKGLYPLSWLTDKLA
jgi:hypothetical protein